MPLYKGDISIGCDMSEFEQYTQSARLALIHAKRAETTSDKQAWLGIAEGWLELIRAENDVADLAAESVPRAS